MARERLYLFDTTLRAVAQRGVEQIKTFARHALQPE